MLLPAGPHPTPPFAMPQSLPKLMSKTESTTLVTDARIRANQANAQLSTGPTSPEGKAKVSLNAVKTGLTGRTVLLPSDDAAAYETLVAEFQTKWQPATAEESRRTQSLADTEWRLLRIPELEHGILSVGYRELAAEFADIEDPSARRSATTAKVYLTYVRQLNNLARQEARLRRMREKDTAMLEQLQSQRRQAAKDEVSEELDRAARLYIAAVGNGTDDEWINPARFGFELSIDEIENRALDLVPHLFDAWYAANPEALEEDLAEAEYSGN